MKLDASGIPAESHCFQEGVVVFFPGQAADIDYLERTLRIKVVFRHGFRPDAGIRHYAVGDELQTGLDMVSAQAVQNVFRGTLDIVTEVEGVFFPGSENGAVKAFPITQETQRVGDVLRMQMISGRDRFSHFTGYMDHPVFNHEGLFQVNDIGPLGRFLHKGRITGGKAVSLSLDDGIDNRKHKCFQLVVRLRLRGFEVGAGEDAYLVAGLFQILYCTACTGSQTIARNIKVINYKKDFHSRFRGFERFFASRL